VTTRNTLVGLLALATAAVLAGCGVAAAAPHAATTGWTGTGDIRWMINSGAIDLINGNTGNTTLTTNAFDNDRTNETGTIAPNWQSVPTRTYTSYTSFTSDVTNLAPGSWVLYDNEAWTFTPPPEQQDPGTYMAKFVALAHRHQIHVILTPAVDITTKMTSCEVTADPSWQNYLTNCDLPTLAGDAHPDAFEIQAQGYQDNTDPTSTQCGCYAWFVRQAAGHARAVSGEQALTVYSGLSTNHSGAVSTGANLHTDSLNTQQAVDGYWLNVPKQGKFCPACTPSGDPEVAVAYLRLLGYSG
jgi:hypothetical protein